MSTRALRGDLLHLRPFGAEQDRPLVRALDVDGRLDPAQVALVA